MSNIMLREMLVIDTAETLKRLQPDGSLGEQAWAPMAMLSWAICHTESFPGNPFHRDPKVLDAIRCVGDYNARSCDGHGGYSNLVIGWDEWRTFAWMEAMERVRADLDPERLATWTRQFVGAAEHILAMCLDMDTFDGGIPNHGIWGHAFLYRVGRLYGRKDMVDMATLAFQRILAGQTSDGCFREGQSHAFLQGTPVTAYNLVSLMAVNMYHQFSRDPAALPALEKGWHWYYDYLLPDWTMPPALDSRQVYAQVFHGIPHVPAYFFGKPEWRFMARRSWEKVKEDYQADVNRYQRHLTGFLALQYPAVGDETSETEPVFPEYTRMIAEEACIRRRNGWAVVLTGMTNRTNSNHQLRLWWLERQNLVNIFHRDLGLIVGAAQSRAQEELSTMVFYENGAAWYLHNHAYLKSTPPLDTLFLRYGSNIGTVSVDTTRSDRCDVQFSMHGERGKRTMPGIGHPITAMAARGRLALRLKAGDTVTHNGQTRTIGGEPFTLAVQPGEPVAFGRWSIESPDSRWTLRWPVDTENPYAFYSAGERIAILEVLLYTASTSDGAHPNALFRIVVR